MLATICKRVLVTPGAPIAVLLVILIAAFSVMSPVFLTPSALVNYLTNAIPLLLLTVGVAVVIVGGGIDLSVGSVAGFSAGMSMWVAAAGGSTPIAIVVGVATGILFGAFNALLIRYFQINDFIVTLATMNIAGGALIVLAENVNLQAAVDPSFGRLVHGSTLSIPNSFIIAFAAIVVAHIALTYTTLGRRVYAIGVSPAAANMAGVNVGRVRSYTFIISGGLAGLAGVLLASRLGAVQAFLGSGYEFTAIAGAVLGGISLAGGRGSLLAALAGGLFLVTLQQGLRLNGVDPVYFSIVTGICIVLGVVLDARTRAWVRNRMARTNRPTLPPHLEAGTNTSGPVKTTEAVNNK